MSAKSSSWTVRTSSSASVVLCCSSMRLLPCRWGGGAEATAWLAGLRRTGGFGRVLMGTLDLYVRQPFEPPGQVPVALADQCHRRGHEHRADDGRVDQQRRGDA